LIIILIDQVDIKIDHLFSTIKWLISTLMDRSYQLDGLLISKSIIDDIKLDGSFVST